eukprot:CAMPEP_0174833720 /NCGR_PEP_ID=MMETSP1114-20130205/4404_1 /TAXON_ID=312471 /ORGANISM="Neobodo designis, Strain CCAP 1951/1" /LENGTH=284 /DNA_ID=CAMNT_0016067611 /DNA_START=68 /DNA_END=922 /DNA_ORIENTATION=-
MGCGCSTVAPAPPANGAASLSPRSHQSPAPVAREALYEEQRAFQHPDVDLQSALTAASSGRFPAMSGGDGESDSARALSERAPSVGRPAFEPSSDASRRRRERVLQERRRDAFGGSPSRRSTRDSSPVAPPQPFTGRAYDQAVTVVARWLPCVEPFDFAPAARQSANASRFPSRRHSVASSGAHALQLAPSGDSGAFFVPTKEHPSFDDPAPLPGQLPQDSHQHQHQHQQPPQPHHQPSQRRPSAVSVDAAPVVEPAVVELTQANLVTHTALLAPGTRRRSSAR